MRILLIEDDAIIGDGIKTALGQQALSVDWVKGGREGEQALYMVSYDAVILDLTLPGIDGLDILAHWRAKGYTTPVLILTARGTLEERVEGLNQGADDYLGKPFALAELVARVFALIRRSHGQASSQLQHGAVTLDMTSHSVFCNDTAVDLSPKAIALVEIFMQNKGRVLSKELLEEKLYPWGEEVCSNAVEVHVHHIRRKLGTDFIKTVYGAGYKLGDTHAKDD